MSTEKHVVTGAYGYSGKYIAQRLLDAGHEVRTLTNSTRRSHSFGDKVAALPFHFDDPEKLATSLRGVDVLYNTYWIRFNHADFSHSEAVTNTLTLFEAAKKAGIGRIVHVSITNPSTESPLEYFNGKARLEEALKALGVPYAILRPTVLFGKEDILINNIAWLLRKLPVFGVFGDGQYRLQPIYVDDLARLAVDLGQGRENVVVNAIGPETFTYRELVTTIGRIIDCRRPLISVPPSVGVVAGKIVGKMVDDVVITREEIAGLMSGLLHVDTAPTGATKLSEWAAQNASTLGNRYASELGRRRERAEAYAGNLHP